MNHLLVFQNRFLKFVVIVFVGIDGCGVSCMGSNSFKPTTKFCKEIT